MIKQGNDKVNRILYRGTDDVARAVMGGDWRMPTMAEFEELLNNTTKTYETISGIKGVRFTANNGNSIFLPFGGSIVDTSRSSYNSELFYNSSDSATLWGVNYLYASSTLEPLLRTRNKGCGHSVRAVSETQGVDLGLSVKWAECNVGANTPTEYGNYYAWGELAPKIDYSWATYKFNPSGDGVTFTKYNATDGKRTLELDCECEIEKVMQGGDVIFFKPIEYTKDFSSENLSLVSACAVLDALQEITTAQTITFSAYTTSLINASNNALAKVYDTVQKGWTIVGEGLKDYVELEWIKKEANDTYRVVPSRSKRTDDMRIGVEFYTRKSNTKDFLIGYLWQRGNPDSTIAIMQQSGLLFFYYGLSAFNIAVKENEKIYAEVDRDGGYINGKKVGSFDEQSLASSTSNITLFGIEGTSYNCEVKISKYTISTASTYEEFVPIRKTDDGTIRLFDRINNSYGNVHGTGTLSGGEPKQD